MRQTQQPSFRVILDVAGGTLQADPRKCLFISLDICF
jgi:hypothetical protein